MNKKVILHIEDSSCISARAEFNAEKLITEQKVKLLMGSSSSEESLSNRKIASKHSVVYLPNIDHSNICTSKEFSGSSIFFDNSISANLISKEIGHHNTKENLNVLHIFSDYSWSTNQKASFSKALSSRYLKIDQSEIEFDVKNIIKKINENVSKNQPDYLIVNLYGTQLVDFLNQVKNLNPEAKKVKKVVPLLTHNIIKQINLTEIGDVIYTHFTPNTSSAKDFSNKFEALYTKRFNVAPTDASTIGFIQLLRFANAANVLNSSDANAINDYLANNSTELFSTDNGYRNTSFVKVGRNRA